MSLAKNFISPSIKDQKQPSKWKYLKQLGTYNTETLNQLGDLA